MITNFKGNKKTKSPSCCNLACCGNKFGRIGGDSHYHGENRIIKTRRYAKRAERNIIRNDILAQLRGE
jgi:hypothetical protein